ncbi:aromatic aminobenezylarsenical efflux permease ArsG family transporter [Candidatus Undinarchaeota archaeon]
MDLMTLMEAMSTNSIPLIAAFFIGLMTSFSPCPLATNITAIAAVSRKIGKGKETLIVGITYTAGRIFAYTAVASLTVWAGLNIQQVSHFLQKYGESALGPFLILVGILFSGIVSLPTLPGNEKIEALKKKLPDMGLVGIFFLGMVFALAFCPFSAVLFFGMLIPLALAVGDAVLIPSVFGFATGLPVIICSYILSQSVSTMGDIMGKVNVFEKWTRHVVSAIFIIVGIYYVLQVL